MNRTIELPNSMNLPFVEGLYADFLREPSSVLPEWRGYFEGIEDGERTADTAHRLLGCVPGLVPSLPVVPKRSGDTADARMLASLQDRVDQLIRAYRLRGHMIARLDPLGLPRPHPPELRPEFYDLTEADLQRRFSCQTFDCDGDLTLAEILQRLQETYCRSIGVEYMHIDDAAIRRWLRARMEPTGNRLQLDRQEQVRILSHLTDAVIFEEFIRKKFVGAKSFSLEGSESLIPLLDLAIEQAASQGVDGIVLGMAHRGRLNVLANIMGKHPRQIFREFADADPDLYIGRGDVKYHLGYSSDWTSSAGRQVHLSLCFNPSHLEFVDPVALGRVRAKQDRFNDTERSHRMALLIHGDAAFAAQGVLQEILNLSQLPGYAIGGTLHVVVNNQIGFTTSPQEARSTTYATDVAKMLQVPIFHVNGEDPEAVAQVVKVAMEFRAHFQRDVVIDMYGYRRLGHNEGDEPSFTQPLLYQAIQKRKSVREGYLEHLLKLGGLTAEEAAEIARRRQDALEKALAEAQSESYSHPAKVLRGVWAPYSGGPEPTEEPETGVERSRLAEWLAAQAQLPSKFHSHPKIKRLLETRQQMATGSQPIDWSAAESLALASLAVGGCRIRLTGQDTARGTFSQRQAVLHDYGDGHEYVPLQHLATNQASVEICNSPLSEVAVLGFEYGYSLDAPDRLVMWEAQFGDFCNAAQVIIDQFIASAEDKWRRLSGLVLLLPHGFEGQGPEHSSARLERFLALAAEDNIQVVYPSTPAQYFHVLRRQMLRRWRKPLVIMTPKSLLRHPQAISTLDDCARGIFRRIIPDGADFDPKQVKRILMCSGKVYYDLAQHRQKTERNDVALLRLEQLYPLNQRALQSAMDAYAPGTPFLWVQEEPENMGPWRFLRVQFGDALFGRHPFSGIYRPASASPATGSATSHKQEQAQLVELAFSSSGPSSNAG